MKIFRAIGFGLALIIIRIAMPDVFHAFENTLLKFFDFFGTILSFGAKTFDVGINQDLIIPASINLVP